MISLKAPGNHSDQFWFNKIPILLCEGPKPPNYMISGFLDPWEPLSMDLNIPKLFFGNIRKLWIQFQNILFP